MKIKQQQRMALSIVAVMAVLRIWWTSVCDNSGVSKATDSKSFVGGVSFVPLRVGGLDGESEQRGVELKEFVLGLNASLSSLGSLSSSPSFGVVVLCANAAKTKALIEALLSLGCHAPVDIVSLEHETSNNYNNYNNHNNYFTSYSHVMPRTIKPPAHWSAWHIQLGAAKPSAVLTSRFQRVLFLDPDVLPLQNPEFLLNTKQFIQTGALFWPDYRPTHPENKIWAILGFKEASSAREWDSGFFLVDKGKKEVMDALKVAEFMCVHSYFYFNLFWGDKEAFRWAFAIIGRNFMNQTGNTSSERGHLREGIGRDVVFHVNIHSPHPVGILEPDLETESNPDNASLNKHSPKALLLPPLANLTPFAFPLPEKTIFCGQSFLHWDLDGTDPLFLHMSRLKRYNQWKGGEQLDKGAWPLFAAQGYSIVENAKQDISELAFHGTRCEHVPGYHAEQCCRLGNVVDADSGQLELGVVTYHVSKRFPKILEMYRKFIEE